MTPEQIAHGLLREFNSADAAQRYAEGINSEEYAEAARILARRNGSTLRWGKLCDCGAMITVDMGLQPLMATDYVVCPACRREHPGDTMRRQEWHYFGAPAQGEEVRDGR